MERGPLMRQRREEEVAEGRERGRTRDRRRCPLRGDATAGKTRPEDSKQHFVTPHRVSRTTPVGFEAVWGGSSLAHPWR